MEGLETPAVETPAVEPVVAPVADPVYFGTDGSLAKGWQKTMPEGYREEKSLETVDNVKTVAKMFVDTKRMVGKNTIAIPDETSSVDEWSQYYEHGGRPAIADDYGLAVPEGFPPELVEKAFPADRMSKWQQRFFDGGVSKKAASQFIAEFANDMLADLKTQQQADQMAKDELVSGLSRDWGAAMDQNKHLGNIAVEEGTLGDVGFKQRLTDKFGDDPDFIRYSSNLGKKFSEGRSPDFSAIPTPSDLQTQIDEIEANPLYLKGTQKQRMELASRVMAIRAKMNPTKTT